MTEPRLPEKVGRILARLNAAGHGAYVVGGCVRDSLLGRPVHDWDICTSALPDETRAVFADGDVRDTGLKHGTVTLVIDHEPFEITTFRVDGLYSDSRHPDSVTFTGSVREDLRRRDLTINAMAYSPREGLIDPFDGRGDLAAGVLRCVGDPAARYTEDALRILRTLRFQAQLGFSVEPDTDRTLRALAGRLGGIAPERIKTELEGMLTGPHVLAPLLDHPDVLAAVIPEIAPCVGFDQLNPYHIYDVWEHTAHSVDNIAPDPLLRWTMLMHDLGKPPCFSAEGRGTLGHFYGHGKVSAAIADDIMTRLRFSNDERAIIRELVETHDRFIPPTPRGVRRALSRMGRGQFFRSLEVCVADIKAQNPVYGPERIDEMSLIRRIACEILAARECLSLKDLAVNGRDLLAIGYMPGPAVGAELQTLLALVVDEPEKNDRAVLLELAERDRPPA